MSKLDRVAELRFMYNQLRGQLASGAEGSGAAAIVREMRLLSAELEVIDKSGKVSKTDEVAARRRARTGVSGPPSRRRKSG
jgi:hypothetical protein